MYWAARAEVTQRHTPARAALKETSTSTTFQFYSAGLHYHFTYASHAMSNQDEKRGV